jgi:two-component system response regulator YesN
MRRQLLSGVSASDPPPSYRQRGRITAAALIPELERYLRQHTHEWLSLEDVAVILAVEKTYCSRLFRKATGQSFSAWNRSIRIRVAQDMLRESGQDVSKIAAASGYGDLTTFERNFRLVAGMCPTKFRQVRCRKDKNRRTKPQ